jgi:hypothetical protein
MAVRQTAGVVLQVDFSIRKRHDGIVAVVLGKVGTHFVANVVQEVELVLESGLHFFLAPLLLHQMVASLQIAASVDHGVHRFVDAELGDETVDPRKDLGKPP